MLEINRVQNQVRVYAGNRTGNRPRDRSRPASINDYSLRHVVLTLRIVAKIAQLATTDNTRRRPNGLTATTAEINIKCVGKNPAVETTIQKRTGGEIQR